MSQNPETIETATLPAEAAPENTSQPSPSQDSQASSQKTSSSSNTTPETSRPTSHRSEYNAASALKGGREISKKTLYVGGLNKSVEETELKELFGSSAEVYSVKILNDKNKPELNYAFIEFHDEAGASRALESMNGKVVHDDELKINYAFQSATFTTSQNSEEPIYNIFVGDLSPEVDDEALHKCFSVFASMKSAHVMWDMQTSRSRGYGFVTFGSQSDAQLALQTMSGRMLCGRNIRCNWASHKQNNRGGNSHQNNNQRHSNHNHNNNYVQNRGPRPFMANYNPSAALPPTNGVANGHMGGGFEPAPFPMASPQTPDGLAMFAPPGINGGVMSPQSYDMVLRQTPSWQSTVYLGNIAHFTQQEDLIPLLQNFGYIVDFKFHPDKGCAFVKYDTHERAALAIVQLTGFAVNGRALKCGWGKSRGPAHGQYQNFSRNGSPMYQRR